MKTAKFFRYVSVSLVSTAWVVSSPSRYQLYGADGTKLRESKYIYDGGSFGSSPSRGSVTAVESWLDSGQEYREESSFGSYGERLSQTDALGRVTYMQYDDTRTFVTQVINALGQPTRFGYDSGTGNLLWSEKNGIRTSYKYDVFGRILKEVQPYDSQVIPTKTYTYYFDGTAPESIKVSQKTTANNTLDTYYYYDGLGNLVQVKTPSYDGKQVVSNFFYDSLNRVRATQNAYFDAFSTAISTPSVSEKYTNYTYDALSRVVNVTNPDYTNVTIVFSRSNISTYDENRHRKDYVVDAYDRIMAVKEYNIDSILNDGVVSVYATAYGYDGADNLVQINDTYGNQFKFTYDSLGRRTRLNDPDIGEVNYTYDLVGNLVSQVGGSGNLVTGDGYYREYNALNQLIRIRNGSSVASPLLEQYYYDHLGQRIKVWRNDSAKTVIYTPFREFMQIRNSSGIFNFTYIYDGSTLVARVNPDGNKYFYHPDQLGSTTLITDQNGNVVENTFYEPFGDVTSGGSKEVKLYTGQFSDDLTDQYYYGARYYDPVPPRFIQPDPIIQNVYNPQNLNRYSYVLNNPYKYVDYKGHWALNVQFGGSGGGGPWAGSGSINFGFSFNADEGLNLGFFGSESEGYSYIGVGEGFIGVSLTPNAKKWEDLLGKSTMKGISVAYGHGVSLDVATSDSNENIKSYSLSYSPGLSLEYHKMQTDSSGSYLTLFHPSQASYTYMPTTDTITKNSKSSSGSSTVSSSRGISITVKYTTTGKIAGGSIGKVRMSAGFAKKLAQSTS
jgi:RHS repeat-associated protein